MATPSPAGPSKRPRSTPVLSTQSTYYDYINLPYLVHCTNTDQDSVNFCQHYGLLPKTINCDKCGNTLTNLSIRYFATESATYSLNFRCHKKSCNKVISAKKNTWFESSKVSLQRSLILTYMFISKASYDSAIKETSGPFFNCTFTSRETVSDIYSYCREVCIESLYTTGPKKKIGGPNCIVEIDEAKFGKRKFNKGRFVEGQWVLGGICREDKDCFFEPVPDRSEATLIAVIQENVELGSIIHTDEWRSYSRLGELGYTHRTVNHSQHFVDPQTGTHTNTIESTWWALKRSLPSTHTRKENFAAHLAEFIWRRKNKDAKCLFTKFLEDIQRVYPGL